MAKIWLVTTGEYSDYRVVAAASNEANAERIQKETGADGVEEYDLDPGIEEMNAGLSRWRVRMDREGNSDCEQVGGTYDFLEVGAYRRTSLNWRQGPRPTLLLVTVWAKDREHAVKIVNEKRLQMIALGEWSEGA